MPVRRPLTARSVVASTLLGVDPPRLPARALVRSGELFGLRPGATRTALSRMVAAGEVVSVDGDYALAGPDLLERHARQQAARSAPDRPWDGTWVLAVVLGGRRPPAERAAFRQAALRWKLAEVREGCWARPDNIDPDRSPAAAAVVAAQAVLVRGARPEPDATFVAALGADDWAADARELVTEMRAAQAALDDRRTDVLGPTFGTAAAVLRHLVADPLLPEALRPPGWPAAELRATFDDFDRGFKATWRNWHRSLSIEST